ncbi:MAG: hypothetical protein ACK5P5_11980 [Pseudobdellovibrionaceae bacterium]
MMKTLCHSLLFIIAFTYSSFVYAQKLYSGSLMQKTEGIFLMDDQGGLFLLKSDDVAIYSNLKTLQTGDLVVLTSEPLREFNPKPVLKTVPIPTIYVSSILRVGIQKILGVWRSKDDFLKFDNFDDFSAFHPQYQDNKLISMEARKFRYYLIPDISGRFVISFTNSQSNKISAATLDISDSRLTIEIIDNNTGQVTERKRYERLKSR